MIILGYLLGCFIHLDMLWFMKAAEWSEDGRLLVGVMFIMLFIVDVYIGIAIKIFRLGRK